MAGGDLGSGSGSGLGGDLGSGLGLGGWPNMEPGAAWQGVTQSVWPLKDWMHSPVTRSNCFSVRSLEAVKR